MASTEFCVQSAHQQPNLVRLLEYYAQVQPNQVVYSFASEREADAPRCITFAELDLRARAIAAVLSARDARGRTVLLLYPSGLDYIAAFFGCLYAGAIAVPAYPPDPRRLDKTLPRVIAIAQDCGAQLVLSTDESCSLSPFLAQKAPLLAALTWCGTDHLTTGDFQPAPIATDQLAFLQYTSGSTSTPKGVMVTHGNLMANEYMIHRAMKTRPDSVVVGWLPLYHDMGLIGNVLHPVYLGASAHLMSPLSFLQSPLRWLRAITSARATTSGGPNFAYELCARRAASQAALEGIDLSTWEIAFNGAEPIRRETMQRFAAAFEPYGFRARSVLTCYGLAEATLIVSGAPSETLRTQNMEPCGAKPLEIVGCGPAAELIELAIVDPTTQLRAADGTVGEVWVHGPNVAAGYFGRADATRETFQAELPDVPTKPFLRTGDLGLLANGELFITGRMKDLIIVRGRNVYPTDLEATVESAHAMVRVGCCAAFSVEQGEGEEVVVAFETKTSKLDQLEEIFVALRTALARDHDISVYALVAVKTASIPKTTSGKLQRRAARAAYLAGRLDVVREWRQGDALEPRAQSTTPSAPAPAELRTWLIELLASKLRLPASKLDATRSFSHYGMDSKTAVELSGLLSEKLGKQLDPSLLYEYPNIDALLAGLSAQPTAAVAAKSTATYEPIAIVGLDCRFPGAHNPNALWQLLRDGGDAVRDLPEGRWDVERYHSTVPVAGKMIARQLASIDDIELFDPGFFGIRQHEAKSMDPQHRLLLEVAWSALEDAGMAPSRLRGSRTGVFVGMSGSDYAERQRQHGPEQIDVFSGTGSATSPAAGRISYLLGFTGPSMVIDTACSSSLVAVHQACRALQVGDCNLALAGGVNLILNPDSSVYLSTLGVLSSDGRCRSFADGASGYGRGEGCGLVVLKRLSDALAQQDEILGVIRASCVNQDGASNGLTAPNPAAQRALLRDTLQLARLSPADVDYVEAHGTGTELGDPLEAHALADVLAGDARTQPLALGSVKANIGHLEAAAGVAGLIKTVLALQHEEIPAQRYARSPSRAVRWQELKLLLPTSARRWPRSSERRRNAGVSSFGMSGTNAHLIVSDAPEAARKPLLGRSLHVLPISAKSPAALQARIVQAESALREVGGGCLAALCSAWARGRAELDHRIAVVAGTRAELSEALAAASSGAESKHTEPRITFLFTGQGSQYKGMGQRLYESEVVFRDAIDRCAARATTRLDRPLLSLLHGPDAEHLSSTQYTQPALFALQYALCMLWRSWGIEPAIVVGHSVGELAAAWAAGVLTLEDAFDLACARGRAVHARCTQGAMLAVETTAAVMEPLIAEHAPELVISGFNAPTNLTVSGALATIETFAQLLHARGIKCTRLDTSRAFHSPHMDAARPELLRALTSVQPSAPSAGVAFISTLTGKRETTLLTTPEYYTRQLCEPVRFEDAMHELDSLGPTAVVEIGPHPTLLGLERRCLPSATAKRHASLSRQTPDDEQMLRSLAQLYVGGSVVRWDHVEPANGANHVFLPTYPFERERYWIEAAKAPLPAAPEPTVKRRDRTAVATRLREIIASLLDCEPASVSMHTPLVELGADSLVLIEGIQRIQREFAVRVSLDALFRTYPTLDALAGYVTEARVTPAAEKPTWQPANDQLSVSREEDKDLDKLARTQLNDRQHAYLREFSAAYEARTARSKQRQIESRPALVDMRASSGVRATFPAVVKANWLNIKELAYPIVAAQSQAAHIRDLDGNDYVDIAMGFGVHLFGHRAPFIEEAVRVQLERGIQIGPQAEHAAEVAQLTAELTGHERVLLCGSGTEAVMTALRIARAATGRPKIAMFAGSYHGSFDGVLGAIPATLGAPRYLDADVIVLEYGDERSLQFLREHAAELAAVLVEPVQGRRPELQPREFLVNLRACTQELGALLIFDEVLLGFRLHQGGAQAHFGVRADLATYGKIMGGGMPIGAVAGRADVMDHVDGGSWSYGDSSLPVVDQVWFAGTFNKNPLTMATAAAALRHMKASGPELQIALNERTAKLARELNTWFAQRGDPLEVVHCGSLFRFKLPKNAELFYYHLLQRGVYVWENRSCFLSTAHTEEDIARIVEAVKWATCTLHDATFLTPRRPAPESKGRQILSSGGALLRWRRQAEPKLRLFCLPFAGGTAAAFASWAAALPPEVEVCAVDLPGHGNAPAREPLTDFDAVVSQLQADLSPYLDLPFALYGHSMGALLAFELGRAWERAGCRPQALFVSGEPDPQQTRARSNVDLSTLDSAALTASLEKLGYPVKGIDPALLADLLPALSADLRVCDTYRYQHTQPLACGITAFCGASDPLASRKEMSHWQAHSLSSFALRVLPGDHGFLRSERQLLLRHLHAELSALLPTRRTSEVRFLSADHTPSSNTATGW
ncbi:MAG TPA: aminotransferase class III-fold pyridoxal phosphate-dependent enzyme [Polyangiales bacterium]|nr:aminotransferase class III-fold pyridoxal phosphate-dependent enzyme [Polyangiales bacterium]